MANININFPGSRPRPRRRYRRPAGIAGVIVAVIAAIAAANANKNKSGSSSTKPAASATTSAGSGTKTARSINDRALLDAIKNKSSGVLVRGRGTIVKVLPDDDEGDQHQRFLVKPDLDGLDKDHTIKVAHNIDLAERVPADEGDTIEFQGDFEWNDLGGVVHWTHHDPRGTREDGWIKYKSKTYK